MSIISFGLFASYFVISENKSKENMNIKDFSFNTTYSTTLNLYKTSHFGLLVLFSLLVLGEASKVIMVLIC